MVRTSRYLLLCVLTMGMAVGTVAMAQTPGKGAFCSRPIRLALFEYGALYRSATDDGIDARMVQQLAQRTGCKFERVVLPRARIWKEMRAGRLDMATAAVPTSERREMAYLLAYLRSRSHVFLRKTAFATLQNLSDFESSSLKVAIVRGAQHEPAYDEWIGRLRKSGRVVEAVDAQELVRYLDKGVVAAVLSYPVIMAPYMAPTRLERDVAIVDWLPKEQSVIGAMVLSRRFFTAEQARNWDRLLETLAQDGTQYKIHREFLPAAQARDLMYTGPRSAVD